MTWPWNYELPYIEFPSVWTVYETVGNSNVARAVIGFKLISGQLREFIAVPIGATSVVFGHENNAQYDPLWARYAGNQNPHLTAGVASLTKLAENVLGGSIKRYTGVVYKGTVVAANEYQWPTELYPAGADVRPFGPEFDPGTWVVTNNVTGGLIAGHASYLVTPNHRLPTTQAPVVVEEILRVPTDNKAQPPVTYPMVPSSFRATRVATTPGNPAQYGAYSNNVPANSVEWVLPLTITISPGW